MYFAGEEVSWGQHWLGWETPPAIAAVNDQQETNLHNTSSWLDQKPRLALELWVFACAFVCFWRPRSSLGPIKTFWPSRPLWLVSALAIAIRLPERLADAGLLLHPIQEQLRWAELQEWFFAQFMLLYAVDRLLEERHSEGDLVAYSTNEAKTRD